MNWKDYNPLKRWREENGYGIKSAAEIIGAQASSIPKWESGQTVPRVGAMSKLAAAMNVRLFELAGAWYEWLSCRPATSKREEKTDLTAKQAETLEAIRANPEFTMAELARELGTDSAMVRRHAEALVKKGFLESDGSGWVVLGENGEEADEWVDGDEQDQALLAR